MILSKLVVLGQLIPHATGQAELDIGIGGRFQTVALRVDNTYYNNADITRMIATVA